MNRRTLISGLMSLPASNLALAGVSGLLAPSGPVVSRRRGEIIENLDIISEGDAVTIDHPDVVLRNCRIRHARGHGVAASDAPGLVIDRLDIDHVGATPIGQGRSIERNNINLLGCPGARATRVRARRGSSNIYVQDCPGARLSDVELHDARGPEPRGQNVQFNRSPRSILEDFSAENGPSSWTEDNLSAFQSDGCVIRRGLVSYNNSPSGVAVMLEGSSFCHVEDVDAIGQGNGAFGAVPSGVLPSGGCVFARCRTTDSVNSARDGRDAPSSNGLSFYVRATDGAAKHRIVDCSYFNIANPRNLVWKLEALETPPELRMTRFAPRAALRLSFEW